MGETITPQRAAEIVGKSEETLRRWRRANIGPPFVMEGGKPRYRSDLLKAGSYDVQGQQDCFPAPRGAGDVARRSPWMNTEEAAIYVGETVEVLVALAAKGKGPPFWKPNFGSGSSVAAKYHRALLDRWNAMDHRFEGLQSGPLAFDEIVLTHYRIGDISVEEPSSTDPRMSTDADISAEVEERVSPTRSEEDRISAFWERAEAEAEWLLSQVEEP